MAKADPSDAECERFAGPKSCKKALLEVGWKTGVGAIEN